MPILFNNTDGKEWHEPADSLYANCTPNNGITVMIMDDCTGGNWAIFFLSSEEARELGTALIGWADEEEMME